MQISEFLDKEKQPSYRLAQFYKNYYQNFAESYDEFTNWPTALREKAEKLVPLTQLKHLKTQVSKDGGTIKVLFERLNPRGQLLETVLMRHLDNRNSVCVSCMVGCPMGCEFCATGTMGFIANLTADEIVEQVLFFARLLKKEGQKVTNIVFMGMGEPMINLTGTEDAIMILNDPKKFGLGARNITVSTCGVTPALRKFINDGFRGRLALSLHAPNQALREKIMPVARTHQLPGLFDVLDLYVKKTNRRVSYEYILIKDLNDQKEQALELVSLLKDRLAHVNLIPYNAVTGKEYSTPDKKTIFAFASYLREAGIEHTIRITMGADIQAACGQLATKS